MKKSYFCASLRASFFARPSLSRSSRPITRSAPPARARVARSPPAITATLTCLSAAVGSSRLSLILDSGFLRSTSRSFTASSMDWLNLRFSVLALTSARAFAIVSLETGIFLWSSLFCLFQHVVVNTTVEFLDEVFRVLGADGDSHAKEGTGHFFDC